MTKNIFKIFKSVFLILLYFLYSSFVIYILGKLGIDVNKFSIGNKLLLVVGINITLMLILYIIYHKDLNANLKDYFINFKKDFKFGLKYWIIGLLIMVISNAVIMYYYPGNSTNENLVFNYTMKYPLYMVFSSVIYAPFVEEIIFRKSVREVLPNNIVYVILCGLLFGYVHTLAGNELSEFLYIIPYGALGCVFAYIYSKTNNIFVSMTFHGLHNAIIMGYYIIFLLGA